MSEARQDQVPTERHPAPADRIRVLHVIRNLSRAGVETWLVNLLRHLDRDRFEVSFCVLDPQPQELDETVRAMGAHVIPCHGVGGPLAFARSFRAVLAGQRWNVVHCHLLFFSGTVLRLAHQAGVSIRVAHAHSSSDGRSDGALRACYRGVMRQLIRRHATHRIAVSEAAGGYLFGSEAARRREFVVLPCGVDPAAFQALVPRERLCHEFGIPADCQVVAHVGTFRPPKNHEFVLRIAAALASTSPDVRFILVGDGPSRPEMEAVAAEMGIRDRVVFAGVRRDVPILMRNLFDAMILPSLYEGLPVVLLEAQFAGLPSLMSDRVPPEVVELENLVEVMPLEAGPAAWATRLAEQLAALRPDRDDAWRHMTGGRFDIALGAKTMSAIYASHCRAERSAS